MLPATACTAERETLHELLTSPQPPTVALVRKGGECLHKCTHASIFMLTSICVHNSICMYISICMHAHPLRN